MKNMKDKLLPLGDGRYVLIEDYAGIPKGFVTDGGTIPPFLWFIFGHPFDERYADAYVKHDHKYATQSVPREIADKELRDDLKSAGMGIVRRNLVYWGVRVFGGFRYGKK